MKHFVRSLLLTVCVSLASTSVIADSAAKIGVLDWQQLLAKAPQAEDAGKRLEKEFQGQKDRLVNKQKEYQTKREKLQRDKDVMSAQEKSKKEKELLKLEQDVRRLDEELRSDYTTRQREEMDDFIKIVKDIVDKFAQEEAYDMVVLQEATLYISERVDITEKILEKLEKSAKSKTTDVKSEKKDS